MERATWTDERIDEKMKAIDTTFDDIRSELAELRAEMRAGFAELRAGIFSLHRQLTYVAVTFGLGALGLAGVLAAPQL